MTATTSTAASTTTAVRTAVPLPTAITYKLNWSGQKNDTLELVLVDRTSVLQYLAHGKLHFQDIKEDRVSHLKIVYTSPIKPTDEQISDLTPNNKFPRLVDVDITKVTASIRPLWKAALEKNWPTGTKVTIIS